METDEGTDELSPENRVSEITEADEPDLSYPLQEAADAAGFEYLTPELRKEVLGKLVEFEVRFAELTTMQQNFVLAILRDPTNLRKAARTAGYAEKSAHVAASQLIIHPKVAHCIALGQQLREDRTMVSSDRTLNELAIIAFSDVSNFVQDPTNGRLEVVEGIPEYVMRAVSQVEFTTTIVENGDRTTTTYKAKIKLWSKTDALRMLALYQKLFNSDGGTKIVDKSKHVHNSWQFGDKSITF